MGLSEEMKVLCEFPVFPVVALIDCGGVTLSLRTLVLLPATFHSFGTSWAFLAVSRAPLSSHASRLQIAVFQGNRTFIGNTDKNIFVY